MRRARATAAIAGFGAAVLLAAACSQRVSGTPNTAAPSAIPAGFPTTTSALADFIEHGTASLRTVELSLSVTSRGRSVTAFGPETVQDGVVQDVQLVETIPDVGALNLVVKDGVSYAELAPARRPSDKRWVQVRADSSSTLVRSLWSTLRSSRRSAALDAGAVFARATRLLTFLGTQTLDGVVTGHYKLSVSVAELDADYPRRGDLIAAGVTAIPAEVWVDVQGRPRLLTSQLALPGSRVDTEVRLRQFDAPVSIGAPPPEQVDTS